MTECVILLTRPQPAADRFAAMLPSQARVVFAPVFKIVAVDHDAGALHAACGLVFTSEHAVAAAGPARGRRAICVGPRTATAAREAGFDVMHGPGDAARLLPIVAAAGPGFVHPHGRHVARYMPIEGIVVYDQLPLDLTAEARALIDDSAARIIVPVFSPRSARVLAAQMGDARAQVSLVCVSAAADAAWTAPARQRDIAPTPDGEGMCRAVTARWRKEQTGRAAG